MNMPLIFERARFNDCIFLTKIRNFQEGEVEFFVTNVRPRGEYAAHF